MRIITIFSTILTFLPILLYSQSKDIIMAVASYKLTHHYDTSNVNLANIEVFDLFISKQSSHYKSHEIAIQDSIMKADYERTKVMMPPNNRRASDEKIYTFHNNKKQFVKTPRIIGNYIIERSYPIIKWNILPEKKNIASLDCQKAIGNYHGRNYTVWFTTDLPFKSGPWKLCGLPGMIINAEDSTNNIKFEFLGLRKEEGLNEEIMWDNKTTLLEWIQYEKLAKSIEDDPIGFAEKRFGGKITVTNGNSSIKHINPMLPRKSINFPLEALEYYTQK